LLGHGRRLNSVEEDKVLTVLEDLHQDSDEIAEQSYTTADEYRQKLQFTGIVMVCSLVCIVYLIWENYAYGISSVALKIKKQYILYYLGSIVLWIFCPSKET
jgi:hypothetical protein